MSLTIADVLIFATGAAGYESGFPVTIPVTFVRTESPIGQFWQILGALPIVRKSHEVKKINEYIMINSHNLAWYAVCSSVSLNPHRIGKQQGKEAIHTTRSETRWPMQTCVLEQAEHFLEVTKHIFKTRDFCFSTAFIVGDGIEVIRLDLSTEEKKEAYAGLVKKRYHETDAHHLIVIQMAEVTSLSPEQLQEMVQDPEGDFALEDQTRDALLVFISTREEGVVWQIPFMCDGGEIVFDEREVMPSIVSEYWMINRNRHLAGSLN